MSHPILEDQDFQSEARIYGLPQPVDGQEAAPKNYVDSKGFSTGDVKFAMRQNPETGWIFATGTIGNASSGATRANADCEALFLHLWEEFSVTYAPIFNSAGGGTTKTTAAADWAANKRITIPDARGRILVAQDNMGGSAAGNVTSLGSGVNATIPGEGGGAQNVTLTAAQSGVPAHTHAYTDRYASNSVTRGTGNAGASVNNTSLVDNTAANDAADASASHTNMPPVLVLPLFIKL